MNDVETMKLNQRFQHLTNDILHDVGFQRFVRCVSSERGHVRTQQIRQETQVRASRSFNFEGVVQYWETVDIVLLLNCFQNF